MVQIAQRAPFLERIARIPTINPATVISSRFRREREVSEQERSTAGLRESLSMALTRFDYRPDLWHVRPDHLIAQAKRVRLLLRRSDD